MLLGIKGRPFENSDEIVAHDGYAEVWNVQAGSELYCKIREESGEGQSTFPDGHLLGQREYCVSYNGKVWDGDEVVYDPYDPRNYK